MAVQYYISSDKHFIYDRTTKKNGKVYDLTFRIITLDGVERQVWKRGFKTKKLAKEYYLKFVMDYCELIQRMPLQKKDKKKDILFVGDLIRQYMSTLANKNKPSVIYDKNNIFRLYILNKYDEFPIEKLTTEELYAWQDDLWNLKNRKTGEYFSWKYLSKIRNVFHAFLVWSSQRYNTPNNLSKIPMPKKRQQKKEMQFWTKEQFEKFIVGVNDPTYHALFTFMFYTGRRKGELFALTPEDVMPNTIRINKSLSRKTLNTDTFVITSTKADKSHLIPVCDIVAKEIASYTPPEKGFYFGGEKPLADNTVRRRFIEYTKKANLPQIRIHDLRHSFVSLLIHNGGNIFVIADLISDNVEQVTQTYGHLMHEDKLSLLSKL